MRLIMALIFLAVYSSAFSDTYKCDGNVLTDQPWSHSNCKNLRTGKLYKDEPKALPKETENALNSAPRQTTINFGSTPEVRLAKALAVVDSVYVDAQDCDWAIKVTKEQTPCVLFLKALGDFSPAMNELSKLIDEDTAFYHKNIVDFEGALKKGQDIVKIKELALMRSGR